MVLFFSSFQYKFLLILLCWMSDIERLDKLRPLRLKCSPVALSRVWFLTWSAKQNFRIIFVFVFMHHGSSMPCLDLGHWGEPWIICVCKYMVLEFFCLFTGLKATFLGICQALSIAESSQIMGYPLSMSCFLIS